MCLVSIILKEIRGRWIRKYQVLLFFMLRQLKTTDSFRTSDEVAWNLAISEAKLRRGFQNSFYKTFIKNFWNLQRKTRATASFLKHSATLKEDTSVFLWILKFFKNNIFCKMPSGHCFCSLKNHSESIQNLPLECCYNTPAKTPAKKFVLVKFHTCINNWPF